MLDASQLLGADGPGGPRILERLMVDVGPGRGLGGRVSGI